MGILASKTMPFLFKGSVIDLYQIAIPHQIKPRQTPILNATRLTESGRFETLAIIRGAHLERPKMVAYWTVGILKGET